MPGTMLNAIDKINLSRDILVKRMAMANGT